ncbi:tight junction-associated protein 1-like protein, partial [Dinothrombium tinctorium]
CGCQCDGCSSFKNNDDSVVVQLYQEIEHLKRQISERDYHIVQMETSVMNHAKEYPNGEFEALQETLRFWQEKYDRLFESHRKLQKVNQALEDKLLRIVDKFETEKAALTRDVADLTTKLVEARVLITDLEEENDQYKNDCNIAVQLLQCKPSNFIPHKVNSLPTDIQEKVRSHFGNSNNHRRSKSIPNGLSQSNSYGNQPMDASNTAKIIRVPIPTFPPTAMVYSVNKTQQGSNGTNSNSSNCETPDYVSAAIMAKVLEERSKERSSKTGSRFQKCFQCRNRRANVLYFDETSQTSNGQITNEDVLSYPWNYWNENKRRSRNESSSSTTSLDSFSNTFYNSNDSSKCL